MQVVGYLPLYLKIFLTAVPVYQTVWCQIPDVSPFEIWCFDSAVCILERCVRCKQNQIFATGFTVSTTPCLITDSRHRKNKCYGSCRRLASRAGSGCHSGHAPRWRTDHTTWRKQRRTLTSVSRWMMTETSLGHKKGLENIVFYFHAVLWHLFCMTEKRYLILREYREVPALESKVLMKVIRDWERQTNF